MTELDAALNFAIKDVPEERRDALAKAVADEIQSRGARSALEAVDVNLPFGTGGQAFLWEDVLTLSDALDAFNDVPGSLDAIDPGQLAKILVTLTGTWKRLRAVRVPLNEEQFKVLRAIKRGNSKVDQIAAYTALEPAIVDATVSSLKALQYRDGVALVDESQGRLSTRF